MLTIKGSLTMRVQAMNKTSLANSEPSMCHPRSSLEPVLARVLLAMHEAIPSGIKRPVKQSQQSPAGNPSFKNEKFSHTPAEGPYISIS